MISTLRHLATRRCTSSSTSSNFCRIAATRLPLPPFANSVCHIRSASHRSFTSASASLSSSASLFSSSPTLSSSSAAASASPSSSSSSSSVEGKGFLSLDELKKKIKSGEIDTVIVGFTDMYGRLMGKRFDGDFFLESGLKGGTHACDYLLACDMEMNPITGFEYANWERGFGDFHLVPDIKEAGIRVLTWQPRTVLVMCDIFDDKTHSLVPFAPRSVLRAQLDKAQKQAFTPLAASELEYYMFKETFEQASENGYSAKHLTPVSAYFEDYHILQTAREEKYGREFRKHLASSGIPVENSKGECGLGQGELNVKYSTILDMADRHVVYKQCLKEISDQMGASITFMAKPFSDFTGSGCHIHCSLVDKSTGKNLFVGDEPVGPIRASKLFQHFLAGWLKYTPDVMVFYAPTINSYKRFQSSSWAPTRLAWSFDNRTAGYRVCGSGQGLRIECRIPGADCNPYLAFAASLASGLAGIEQKLTPPDIFEGNIYEAQALQQVPKTLAEAADIFANSSFAKKAFGEKVVKHYAHFYKAEVAAYDKWVSDWERKRYFERI